jgi:hypothetical protein
MAAGSAEHRQRPGVQRTQPARLRASSHHLIIIERRDLPMSGSVGIATQLFHACQAWPEARFKAVVAVERPGYALSGIRKQWLKHVRQLAIERSSTLDRARVAALTRQMALMEAMRFSVGIPADDAQGVFLVEPARLGEVMAGAGADAERR